MFPQPEIRAESNQPMGAPSEVQPKILGASTDLISEGPLQPVVLPSHSQTVLSTPSRSAVSERRRDLDVQRVTKYYAVRRGFRPGIYTTWGECDEMVRGFSGAVFKAFRTREEAERFIQ